MSSRTAITRFIADDSVWSLASGGRFLGAINQHRAVVRATAALGRYTGGFVTLEITQGRVLTGPSAVTAS